MANMRAWLRPPRNLRILFGVVIFLPGATLLALGFQLLAQDRALAEKRKVELLERAADRAVRVLDQDLAILRRRLESPPSEDLPDDTVWVSLRADRFVVLPPDRLPYVPRAPVLREEPEEPFRELELLEFHAPPKLEKALAIGHSLADSPDPGIEAGALLREARVLRAMGRSEEALAAYAMLARMTSVSIDGEPASLLARRARCAVLEEQRRTQELRAESAAIAADLRAGQWQLDRDTYFYVAGLLKRWSGSETRAGPQVEALAAGVGWLYDRWSAPERLESAADGIHILRLNAESVIVVWNGQTGKSRGFVAGTAFLQSQWLPGLQTAAYPAKVYLVGVGEPPPAGVQRVQRSTADSELPWTVVAVAASTLEAAEFQTRRRNLLAGLAAVIVLVAAAAFFLSRWVNRDLVVARLQTDFVSAVSHEFRTPLTALRQFNDLLAEEDGPTPEKRRRYYEAQSRATDRLHRLVESLLDFARMEAGRRPYRLESIDAGSLAAKVVDEFQKEAAPLGFSVSCVLAPAACRVEGDREALARALWNLLDNALKYAGDSREIVVQVVCESGVVSVAVCDQGIGIPSEEYEQIFDKFVRGAAAKAGNIKGTGLGLAMVRHIVSAHGGTVGVKSAPGAGSVFTMTLPAKEES